MQNYLDAGVRSHIIGEIKNYQNSERKAEHLKRAEVYNDRQRKYVLEMLQKEFSPDTVRKMRTCTSINLTKRIINELSSIYKRAPERTFNEATDEQKEHLENLYSMFEVDVKLKRANRKYKLHDQATVQIIPKDNKLCLRVLSPHQFDVIPSADDPEVAEAYIISTVDRQFLQDQIESTKDIQGSDIGAKTMRASDNVNQKIADEEDYRASLERFVWWTKDFNFITDGKGNIIGDPEDILNPIGELPFVDVASEKDFEYWVRKNSNAVEFNLDFSVVMSDTCNTNRLQGYAQAVITGEKIPENITVGPNNVLFLPINPDRPETKPVFEFVSPQPDLNASLSLQDRLLSYFLTTNGIDPKTVTGVAEGQSFTSGFERMLAMIDRFEASQDDYDLFQKVEEQVFRLIVKWNNALQGTDFFKESLRGPTIPETVWLTTNFSGPEKIRSDQESEDSIIRRMEAGLISRAEAIAEDRDIDLEEAKKLMAEIDAHDAQELSAQEVPQLLNEDTQEQVENEDATS